MRKIITLKDKRIYHGFQITSDAYWIKIRWTDRRVAQDISIPRDLIETEEEDTYAESHAEQGEVKDV